MKLTRAQDLLEKCLEGSATFAEEQELVELARHDPAFAAEIENAIRMDAALRRRGRCSTAFVAVIIQRIAQKKSADRLVDRTMAQIRQQQTPAAAHAPRRASSTRRRTSQRPSRRQPTTLIRLMPALAAAAIVALVGVVLHKPREVTAPTEATLQVRSLTGTAYRSTGSGALEPLASTSVIHAGDRITLQGGARLTLAHDRERTVYTLSEGARLWCKSLSPVKALWLTEGEITASVAAQGPQQGLILSTNYADAAVIGTELSLRVLPDRSRLDVKSGAVRFTRREDMKSTTVRAGEYAEAGPDCWTPATELAREQPVAKPAPPAAVESVFFKEYAAFYAEKNRLALAVRSVRDGEVLAHELASSEPAIPSRLRSLQHLAASLQKQGINASVVDEESGGVCLAVENFGRDPDEIVLAPAIEYPSAFVVSLRLRVVKIGEPMDEHFSLRSMTMSDYVPPSSPIARGTDLGDAQAKRNDGWNMLRFEYVRVGRDREGKDIYERRTVYNGVPLHLQWSAGNPQHGYGIVVQQCRLQLRDFEIRALELVEE